METRDIWKASALHSLGFKCLAEKVSERQFVFIFEDIDEVNEALKKYERCNLPIDVSTLQTSYKTLKNITFKN
jgi:hypothetical protein